PTQCTAITIASDKITEVINYLNEFYPKKEHGLNWSFQLNQFHFSNSEELARLTNRLFQVTLGNDLHKEALADLVLKELMIRILFTQVLYALKNTTTSDRAVFTCLNDYIRDSIGEKLSVEDRCTHVGMSKRTLSRDLKAPLAISLMQFLIHERLTHP